MRIETETESETSAPMIPKELAGAYSLIAEELEQVMDLLLENLHHEISGIDQVIRYSFKLGGKRLRPVLVLLSALAAGGKIVPAHLQTAAALELIHSGTLVHDDILDGARFRRHLQTIHIGWDSKTAVLTGDFLLILAIRIMTKTRDLDAYHLVAEACGRTCDGELRQTRLQGCFEMSLDDYFKIISGKTAALLQCCCELGAYFAGGERNQIAKFASFGYNLGLAFQIIDDILDLTGMEEKTGKTLGTDLINKKPTLPLLYYLQDSSETQKQEMRDLLGGPMTDEKDRRTVCIRLIEFGSIDKAFCHAEKLLTESLDGVLALKDSGEENPRRIKAFQALSDLAQFVIKRKI